MFVYWAMFGLFAVAVQLAPPPDSQARDRGPLLMFGGLVIALLIGFRYKVGGDWGAYQRLFDYFALAPFEKIFEIGDPGYHFLSWSVQQLGGEVWVVNLIAGLIFSWGLVRLARTQPYPWLALLVAIPYLVIVVAMGYSRQGLAIGVIMAGMSVFQRDGSVIRFALYVTVAALFHRSAVVALPLVAFGTPRNTIANGLVAIGAFAALYDLFVADSLEQFVENYITQRYASQGAGIRMAMALLPATLFLFYRKQLGFEPGEERMWRNFSFAAFGFLLMLMLLPSSTVVDRLSLYVLPLQLAVIPRLAGILFTYRAGLVAVTGYSFAVQYVWLNYAAHAQYWVPYSFYPLP